MQLRARVSVVTLVMCAVVPSIGAAGDDEPRVSIWLQPALMLSGQAVAAGAHAKIGGLELMGELTAMSADLLVLDASGYARGIWGSIGPVIRFDGLRRGWFVVPRAFAAVLESEILANDASRRPFVRGYLAHVGLDAGYEWRWNLLTVAVVTGASVGYAIDATPGLFLPALPAVVGEVWLPTSTGHGLSYGINANLLRVGIVF